MMDADYADDLALLTKTPTQAELLLHSLEQVAGGIGLYVKVNKTESIYLKQGAISTLSDKPLKLVDHFTYLSSNISSTDGNVNIHIGKI